MVMVKLVMFHCLGYSRNLGIDCLDLLLLVRGVINHLEISIVGGLRLVFDGIVLFIL